MFGCRRIAGRPYSRVSSMKAVQNLVRGVLKPCVRLVQLPGCFAGQLAKLVAIGHMRKCPKYQIRTHNKVSFLGNLPGWSYLAPPVRNGSSDLNCLHKVGTSPLRRINAVCSSKCSSKVARYETDPSAIRQLNLTCTGIDAPEFPNPAEPDIFLS
jgi:hypothetical protein